MKKILSISSLLVAGIMLSACSTDDQPAPTAKAKEPEAKSITVPTTQMAIVQTGTGADALQYQSIPVMEPGADQVLIKVVAAGINPIERRSRVGGGRPPGPAPAGPAPDAGAAGGPPPAGGARPGGGGGRPGGGASGPSVPGGDLAGIVVKLGEGVTNLAVGDAVFTKLAFGQGGLNGAYSEYAVASASHTNPKPTDQTFAEAAGLATVGVTALRTIKHANVAKDQRVFINGIAGGIGSSAAQFALARGAYVLGTASGRHHEYLAEIGVNEAINYREVQFDEVITEEVDVAIETVSTATANQAVNILKKGGNLVSIAGAADAALCEAKEVNCSRIGGEFGWSNEVMLKEVYELAQAGHYRLNVDTTFPLQEATAAQDLNFNVGTRGKIVLIVDEEMAQQK